MTPYDNDQWEKDRKAFEKWSMTRKRNKRNKRNSYRSVLGCKEFFMAGRSSRDDEVAELKKKLEKNERANCDQIIHHLEMQVEYEEKLNRALSVGESLKNTLEKTFKIIKQRGLNNDNS